MKRVIMVKLPRTRSEFARALAKAYFAPRIILDKRKKIARTKCRKSKSA